jgi:hypothetical protein
MRLNVKVTHHPWSVDALFNKALLYVGEMERLTAGDWRFGLWSSLSLELLARAALANISPTLLANISNKEWRNINYALGNPPTKRDFKPSSATSAEVFSMLNELLPEFSKELQSFCALHCANRNAELHTGEERLSGSKLRNSFPSTMQHAMFCSSQWVRPSTNCLVTQTRLRPEG